MTDDDERNTEKGRRMIAAVEYRTALIVRALEIEAPPATMNGHEMRCINTEAAIRAALASWCEGSAGKDAARLRHMGAAAWRAIKKAAQDWPEEARRFEATKERLQEAFDAGDPSWRVAAVDLGV